LLCAYRPKSISEFISPPAPTRTPAPLTLTLDTAEDTEAGCTEGACTALGTGTVEGWGCRWEAGTGMGGWVAAWECESARRFPPALDEGEIVVLMVVLVSELFRGLPLLGGMLLGGALF
jgi:hypothetical protein